MRVEAPIGMNTVYGVQWTQIPLHLLSKMKEHFISFIPKFLNA